MISKEDFNKVWRDSSRESILNQYYYDRITSRKWADSLTEIESIVYSDNSNVDKLVLIQEVLTRLEEDK